MFHDAGTTEAGDYADLFLLRVRRPPGMGPESGKLKCPYCGHFTDVTADETKPEEYPLEAAPTAAQQDWGEKKRVVRCQGCGAETVLGAEETATLCPFCGSPHVLEDQARRASLRKASCPSRSPRSTPSAPSANG